ncbi:MAG TPA: hypothetical protein VMT24_04365 [Aggregatilineaceae bacterium]|nr:hypothetical protein [Aggregatilineaceae bacterium]
MPLYHVTVEAESHVEMFELKHRFALRVLDGMRALNSPDHSVHAVADCTQIEQLGCPPQGIH